MGNPGTRLLQMMGVEGYSFVEPGTPGTTPVVIRLNNGRELAVWMTPGQAEEYREARECTERIRERCSEINFSKFHGENVHWSELAAVMLSESTGITNLEARRLILHELQSAKDEDDAHVRIVSLRELSKSREDDDQT